MNKSFLAKVQSCKSQKVGIESGVGFFIWCILNHAQRHLVVKNDDFDGNKSFFGFDAMY